MDYTIEILKKAKKETIFKFITSIFIRGLLLIIPVYWSKAINYLTEGSLNKTYSMIFITLLLAMFYYLWNYLNQRVWFNFYNKLYIEYTNKINIIKENTLELGEYTNILNNDIDIICTFLGNGVTRIIQVLEFLVIYIYFLSLDFIIFIVTFIVSILMLCMYILFSKKLQQYNIKRKNTLDQKTISSHELYNFVIDKKRTKRKYEEFINDTKEYLKSNGKYNIFALGTIYLVLAIIELTQYVLVLYGAYLVSIGKMEIGTILLLYSYYAKIITNFEVLGTISADFQSFKVSLNRLKKIS